jgi:hypothetical protein
MSLPRRTIHGFTRASYTALFKHLDNAEIVLFGVGLDRSQLAREAVALQLALAGNTQVSKAFLHVLFFSFPYL